MKVCSREKGEGQLELRHCEGGTCTVPGHTVGHMSLSTCLVPQNAQSDPGVTCRLGQRLTNCNESNRVWGW